MKKVKWLLETGFAECVHEDEFEVEDDATDDVIEEMAKEAAFNCISWTYTVEQS